MATKYVLDASALLAALHREKGHERVTETLPDAVISAVNLAEVLTRLRDRGLTADAVEDLLHALALEVVPFDESRAYAVAGLRASTRKAGLSLGDRACLALAVETGAAALTADRAWKGLRTGARVELLR